LDKRNTSRTKGKSRGNNTKIQRATRTKKANKMKAGYTILNAVSNYDNIVEVINHEKNNEVVYLGWINTVTPYKTKSKESVGVWKLKKLKN
jgi:hypothetical protein